MSLDAYFPAEQLLQLVCPTWLLYCPVPQSTHWSFASAYSPASHDTAPLTVQAHGISSVHATLFVALLNRQWVSSYKKHPCGDVVGAGVVPVESESGSKVAYAAHAVTVDVTKLVTSSHLPDEI